MVEDRKRMETEKKRKMGEGENRKIEETGLNGEEERRKKEEEERKTMEEGWRRQEEEEKKMEAERKKLEEEMSQKEEGEHRKGEEEVSLKEKERRKIELDKRKKKEEEKRQKEEERKNIEKETRRKKEEDEQRKREEMRLQEEGRRKMEEDFSKNGAEAEKRKKEEEEKKKKEDEEKRKMEEERKKTEAEEKKKEEEMRRKNEEDDKRKREDAIRLKEEERQKMEEKEREKRDEEEKRKKDEERKVSEEKRKQQEEEKEKEDEERRKLEERRQMEIEQKKKVEDETRKKEEEKRKGDDEIRLLEEVERKKMEEEEKRQKEEERKNIEKKMRRRREEDEHKKREEMRLQEEGRRKMEEDFSRNRAEEEKRKKEEKEKKKKEDDEKRKMEEEGKKTEAEKKKEEETRRKKEEDEKRKREDAIRLKEEERQKMEEKEREKRDEEEKRKKDEERKVREEEEKRKQQEEEKEKEDKERRKLEERRRMEIEQKKKIEDEARKKEEEGRKGEDEIRLPEEVERKKTEEEEERKEERRGKDEEKRKSQEEERKNEEMGKTEEERKKMEAEKKSIAEETRNKQEEENRSEIRSMEEEKKKRNAVQDREKDESLRRASELQKKERPNKSIKENKRTNKGENHEALTENPSHLVISQLENNTIQTPTSPGPSHDKTTINPITTSTVEDIAEQCDLDQEKIRNTSICEPVDGDDPAVRPSTALNFLSMCLPQRTEQKRRSWMRDCTPWSRLSLQNRRRQRASSQTRRGARRAGDAHSLPPLCQDTLLLSGGWTTLQEVTTVTLEDLPACRLPTPAQCPHLQSLTLRRCGLKSLDGVSQFPELCYIDVQENDITFVDCENMASLRVLRLGRNRLTSIHGLSGADSLEVLELSYNSITRIAGLESMKRLQRLSVDHNQLISTKGLREVYTLLHLDCSQNHLSRVEGLENCALLATLDVRANNLTEPPSLNNHVLLRELRLDDNSICSLQGLAVCWLPLMHLLSVAQNSITQLVSVSDFVSLVNLDLRHNCLSELRNVREGLEGCPLLREVHLAGNPFLQETGWRSTLQKAVLGLRAIDGEETGLSLSPPAVHEVCLPLDSFLAFCQAQLQQTSDLQQQHSRELSGASSPLGAVKISCRHLTEALQLAEDQRFAHEYGDTSVSNKHRAADQSPEETRDMDNTSSTKLTDCPQTQSAGNKEEHKVPSLLTSEEKLATEKLADMPETVTMGSKMELTLSKAYSGSPISHSLATVEKTSPSIPRMSPICDPQELDHKNTAAVVIQQHCWKYGQRSGNISSTPTAEEGGGGNGGKVAPGASHIDRSAVGLGYAATVIQAFWRGFALRKRLASALASAAEAEEDDGFEEVDVDEFAFDEAMLEKDWTFLPSEVSPPRSHPVSHQQLFPKHPELFPEPSQYFFPPLLAWSPKPAWAAEEQVGPARERASPKSTNRTKSPASNSVLSGLSEKSEKILEEWGFTDSNTALLMLKRAQKMKPNKQQQKKLKDPSVRLALFRSCTYRSGPAEARKRPEPDKGDCLRVREAELGLQQPGKAEQVRLKQERTYEWLHTQAADSDRHSESEYFLPEIDPDVLSGGRVQLVAGPGYREHPDQARGLWANSGSAAQPRKECNYPRSNSWGNAREEVPSPQRVTSAPSKKERISFRDNPVQLSGGWGGGKKRDKVCK